VNRISIPPPHPSTVRDEMRQDWKKDFEATVLWAVWRNKKRKEFEWLKYQKGKS
jgi:hypothetical protein